MSNEFHTRRRVLKVIIAGAVTTLILPTEWKKPAINALITPAHAQASPIETTLPSGTGI